MSPGRYLVVGRPRVNRLESLILDRSLEKNTACGRGGFSGPDSVPSSGYVTFCLGTLDYTSAKWEAGPPRTAVTIQEEKCVSKVPLVSGEEADKNDPAPRLFARLWSVFSGSGRGLCSGGTAAAKTKGPVPGCVELTIQE